MTSWAICLLIFILIIQWLPFATAPFGEVPSIFAYFCHLFASGYSSSGAGATGDRKGPKRFVSSFKFAWLGSAPVFVPNLCGCTCLITPTSCSPQFSQCFYFYFFRSLMMTQKTETAPFKLWQLTSRAFSSTSVGFNKGLTLCESSVDFSAYKSIQCLPFWPKNGAFLQAQSMSLYRGDKINGFYLTPPVSGNKQNLSWVQHNHISLSF